MQSLASGSWVLLYITAVYANRILDDVSILPNLIYLLFIQNPYSIFDVMHRSDCTKTRKK